MRELLIVQKFIQPVERIQPQPLVAERTAFLAFLLEDTPTDVDQPLFDGSAQLDESVDVTHELIP